MNLIYFTIGGQPEYKQLLKLVIESIRHTCDPMLNTHILVMMDEKYRSHLHDIEGIDDVMIVENNTDHVKASMRKVEIFKYPKIHDYEKVLFLDCDIIITNNIEEHIFSRITDINKLHVYPERMSIDSHKSLFWSLKDYTYKQLNDFDGKGQHVFNCGQFGFIVTDEMLQHFRHVHDMICTHKGRYFYEQSFMNKYFNTHYLTTETLTPEVLISMKATDWKGQCIVHFAGSHISYEKKLHLMMNFCDETRLRK